MRRLFRFLYVYKASVVFILLELTSLMLIVNHKHYQASPSAVIGSILNFSDELKNYPSLKTENAQLLKDNVALRKQLLQQKETKARSYAPVPSKCDFIPAYVINNSIVSSKNYLTLNRGALHGIAPGMGVINSKGIVGKVQAVSAHFATVTSLLHTSMQVSAKLSKSGVLGTVQWHGKTPSQAQLLYIPRHVRIAPGDTVVTSGYNAVFLEGILVGHVKRVSLKKEAHFYEVELTLSTDFSTLRHVCVVDNTLKPEKDALEQYTQKFYE